MGCEIHEVQSRSSRDSNPRPSDPKLDTPHLDNASSIKNNKIKNNKFLYFEKKQSIFISFDHSFNSLVSKKGKTFDYKLPK